MEEGSRKSRNHFKRRTEGLGTILNHELIQEKKGAHRIVLYCSVLGHCRKSVIASYRVSYPRWIYVLGCYSL